MQLRPTLQQLLHCSDKLRLQDDGEAGRPLMHPASVLASVLDGSIAVVYRVQAP
jgi:hypothetical protein